MAPRNGSLALAGIGLVALLTGCTAAGTTPTASPSASASSTSPAQQTSPSITPSPSTTPSPAPSPSTAAQQRYITAVDQLSPTLSKADPGIVLSLGQRVCAGFRAHQSVDTISEALGRDGRISGFAASDAAIVIGVAVPTLCPQYRKQLDEG